MATVAALFEDFRSALEAIQDLIDNGYRQGDYSLIAQEAVLRETPRVASADTLLGHPQTCQFGGIGPVYAAGPLTERRGFMDSSRSLVDILLDEGIHDDDANTYAEGLRRGGILLLIHRASDDVERMVGMIDRHHPVMLDEQVNSWREEGWNRFDPNSDPMHFDELNWPANITRRPGEDVAGFEDDNWPQTITGEETETEVLEEQASNWPEDITTPPADQPAHQNPEEVETSWPHRITDRDNE